MDKHEIRRRLLARRRALSPEKIREWSAAIADRLRAEPAFAAAPAVLAYVASKDNEADTGPLIRGLLAAGRPVWVPVSGAGGRMQWSRLGGWEELAPGRHGILEPRAAHRRYGFPPAGAACLVPGIGFSVRCQRLGYGGGYFDRFLACFGGVAIGLAYGFQVLPELPVEAHDVRLDCVVTESAIYWA